MSHNCVASLINFNCLSHLKVPAVNGSEAVSSLEFRVLSFAPTSFLPHAAWGRMKEGEFLGLDQRSEIGGQKSEFTTRG